MSETKEENGGGVELGRISRQVSRTGNRSNMLELHAFLPDMTFLTLEVDQHTQATEIMDMIISALGLDAAEARHVLSLWLVSADLELQLKPNHCPNQLFAKWPVYLRKYTNLTEKSAALQKPIIHLRRNVYLPREEDLKIADNEILELLFTEARCNVMDGTYPCEKDLVLKLAGILSTIQYGPFNEEEHTTEFYKSLHSIFPLSVQANNKMLDDCCQLVSFAHADAGKIGQAASAETRDETWFKTAYYRYLNASHSLPYYGANQAALLPVAMIKDSKSLVHDLRQSLANQNAAGSPNEKDPRLAYISACTESLPYYGSVFFDGFIDSKSKSFLHSSYLPVRIGANTDGIFLISAEKEEPLLGILYEELTWDYVEICTCTTDDCPHNAVTAVTGGHQHRVVKKVKGSKGDKVTVMPSLLLQYPARPDEQSENVQFHVVRVYTKSARLIDAFIENCSETMKKKVNSPMPTPAIQEGGGDCVDGHRFDVSAKHGQIDAPCTRESLERSIKGLHKPRKLICRSFTKDGKCVSG